MKIEMVEIDNYNVSLSHYELQILQQIILMGKDKLMQEQYEYTKMINNKTDAELEKINLGLFHELIEETTAAAIFSDTISQTVGNSDSLIKDFKK